MLFFDTLAVAAANHMTYAFMFRLFTRLCSLERWPTVHIVRQNLDRRGRGSNTPFPLPPTSPISLKVLIAFRTLRFSVFYCTLVNLLCCRALFFILIALRVQNSLSFVSTSATSVTNLSAIDLESFKIRLVIVELFVGFLWCQHSLTHRCEGLKTSGLAVCLHSRLSAKPCGALSRLSISDERSNLADLSGVLGSPLAIDFSSELDQYSRQRIDNPCVYDLLRSVLGNRPLWSLRSILGLQLCSIYCVIIHTIRHRHTTFSTFAYSTSAITSISWS